MNLIVGGLQIEVDRDARVLLDGGSLRGNVRCGTRHAYRLGTVKILSQIDRGGLGPALP